MKGWTAVGYLRQSVLRSANTGNTNNVWYATTSGTCTNNNANNTYGVSLDCMDLSIQTEVSKGSSATETSIKCKELFTLPHLSREANKNRRRGYRTSDIPTISSDPFSYENLTKAAHECALGVSWKSSVLRWKLDMAHMCNCLYKELHSGAYKLSKYVTFELFAPKHRTIKSLVFRDRVVQRAMCNNGVYRDLTRSNIYDNCACQKHKGTQFALERLRVMLRRYHRQHGRDGWVLRLDIRHFFDSIPHEQLKKMVVAKLANPIYAKMVCTIIDSFGSDGIGLGLGSQMSQLLAVAYLSDLDHKIKEQFGIKHYIRYSDDMVLVHHDKEHLLAVFHAIKEELQRLGLVLNKKSTLHRLQQGIMFLKFRYTITPTGKLIVRPSRSLITRARRRLFRMIKKGVPASAVIDSFNSWASFALQGLCTGSIKTLQTNMYRRLTNA